MLRRFILIAAFVGATTPAFAIADCRAITDSLLRLRCYDDQAKPADKARPEAPAASPAVGRTVEPMKADYAAYPAGPAYRGPGRMPDFAGRDRDYATFRTRIRDGIRSGVNYAGHLALIQFGCGTGCSVVYVADVRTGQVFPFSLGGEDAQALSLEYRPTSNLIAAQWEDVEKDRCLSTQYVWTGSGFRRLASRDLGKRETCWAADR